MSSWVVMLVLAGGALLFRRQGGAWLVVVGKLVALIGLASLVTIVLGGLASRV